MGEGVLTNMYHMLELIKRNSFELEHKNFKKLAYGQEKWIVNALNVFINMRQNKFSFFMDHVIGERDGCCCATQGL